MVGDFLSMLIGVLCAGFVKLLGGSTPNSDLPDMQYQQVALQVTSVMVHEPDRDKFSLPVIGHVQMMQLLH